MNLERASDAQLVAAFQRGDRADAFEAIHARYSELVGRVCRANAASPEHAEDAAQETFLALHRRLDSFEGGDKLGHYLTRTAKLVAQDLRGQRRRTREVPTDHVADVAPQCGPEDAVLNSVVLARVLEQLPANQRQALVGRHSLGLSRAELADLLDTTEGYVAILLNRASRRARELTALVHGLALVGLARVRRLLAWEQLPEMAGAVAPAMVVVASLVLAVPTLPTNPVERTSIADGRVAVTARSPAIQAAPLPAPTNVTSIDPSTAMRQTAAPVEVALGEGSSAPPQGDAGLVPTTTVPGTDHGVGDRWSDSPDYRYDLAIGGESFVEVDVNDEPEGEAAFDASCGLLAMNEAATCTRGSGSSD